jgi:sugar lactone lactonase YvrE
VRRYTPEGQLDAVIEVPARKVTACTFGGERLGELFVTTSREASSRARTRSPRRCSAPCPE